jgi:WD40 repeat protein/serine/threonine protein kinase
MNQTEDRPLSANISAPVALRPPSSAAEESRVIRAVQDYLALMEAGHKPDRKEFVGRYPEIAEALAECLAGLEFVHGAAPDLSQPPGNRGTPADIQAGVPLGDFRILREIGRGGMGIVYEAEQLSLGRRVALKVLPFAAAMDAKHLQRFKNEAQAAAHLQHQNIVPVHYVGCERGVHFYAMQFIEGQTLAALIQELRQLAGRQLPVTPDPTGAASSLAGELASGHWAPPQRNEPDLPPTTDYVPGAAPSAAATAAATLSTERSTQSRGFFRAAAHLGVQAAEALEHAHQLGVIHRDIKPANLLIQSEPGMSAPAIRLWVTDFGLARLGTDPGLTMTGDLLGTIRYMSPEQALAKRVPIDHRTDIYSLGVTLYELLTLEPAYNGRNREEVLRQIAFEEPRPPRRINKSVPAELETIVLKAMAKNPGERYATAQELADDLKRFLEDKPIKAKRPSLRQRTVKWARRHKTVVRSAVVVLVLAVAALAVSTVLIWQKNRELSQTLERERQFLERERRNGYFQTIALAERAWSANNLRRMNQLLEYCPPDLRGWEWHYLDGLRLKVFSPLRHDSAVLCAVFSPDGKHIASSSQDGKVTLWDAKSGQRLFQFRAHESHARSVAFSPDGQRLATASWDKTVKIWDVQTLAKNRDPSALPVLGTSSIGFMGSPLGPGPFIATSALVPRRIDPSPLHTLRTGPEVIFWTAVFSPDGRCLATSGNRNASGRVYPGEVKIWDPVAGKELCTLEGQEERAWSALAFSPDSQWLATGHKDNVVNIWDVRTGRKRRTFRGHTVGVQCVAFSPDGRLLASGAGNSRDFESPGEVKVWDVASGRQLLNLRGHTGLISTVAFTPDGRLASGGPDQTIKLWDLATGQAALTLHGHFDRVWTLAFSPNGHQLVSASDDLTVRVWDATPLQGLADPAWLTLRGHQGSVRSVAFSPDGRSLASAGLDKTVKVWDAWTGKELTTLRVDRAVVGVAYSPDGRQLASGGATMLRTWDTTTWKEIRSFPQTPNGISSVAFSPTDGKLLAAAGSDQVGKIVWIINPTNGEVIHRLRGHNWAIICVAFDRTGQVAASASLDRTVHIWDVRTGKELVTLEPEHAGAATSVAFSPDGKYLASGSMDRTVKIWNAQKWELLREIPDATGGIRSVAFAPDSRRLAWGGTDGTVKVADVTTGHLLDTLRGHDDWVNSVAYSPDGKHIASASADGTVKIWKAPR